ncbi:hypothetical protein DAEQUDRAFT_449613 [Daedalea quercina L-15889]|uniref:Uncharacterized protein n=1 Tax=Daedalea quercina L-15889 TaxID=1314783 RepID=A0A165N6K3_9APHY|nr:hypothetical protein DAEQUDRAFT_449613 [Daedalea quercina L-15889]
MHRSVAKRSLEDNRDELDAKLELLQQLCLQDATDLQAPDNPHHQNRLSYVDERWIQAEYGWSVESAATSTVSFFDEEEEDMDACMPHLYDPTLFSDRRVASTLPTKPTPKAHKHAYSEKDKPLPPLPRPSLIRRGVPDAPPPSPSMPQAPLLWQSYSSSPPRSPLRTSFSASSLCSQASSTTPRHTPPVSPRLPSSPPRSPKASTFPRGPHTSVGDGSQAVLPSLGRRPSVVHRHATFPSISSTLGLLEERASPGEKRMGVLVTDIPETGANTTTNCSRSTNGSLGRSSGETTKSALAGGSPTPKRPQRPILPALATSTSYPQLRPALVPSSATSSMSDSSFASHTTVVASAAPTTPATSFVSDHVSSLESPWSCGESPAEEPQPTSRWSLDSVASRRPRAASFRPIRDAPSGSGTPQTPTTGKKRDRLISFIKRGRSSSFGKGTPPIPNSANAGQDNILPLPRSSVSREPPFVIASPRPSLSAPVAPSSPMPTTSTFAPTSSTSTTSSAASSASSLQTPISLDMHNRHAAAAQYADPFSPESPSFVPEAYAAPVARPSLKPSAGGALLPAFEYQHRCEQHVRPPTPPTSPPPQPTLPLPSPGTPTASFLVSPQHRSQSFFSSLPFKKGTKRRDKKLVITGVPLEDADDGRETDWKATDKRRRYENVVKWCERFGDVRKIERKLDGTLHVYWRDWESADMVCRVHAQVYIKDVGRVSLAWQYIS